MRFALCVVVACCAFSSSVKAQDNSCPEAEWVSFSLRTPYTPEVQQIVPSVWLPSLLFPCPFLGESIGAAQLPVGIGDGSAGNIALAHSICIGLAWWPCVISILGIPVLLAEQYYVAPVTILNAMDRDVRCARAGALKPTSTPPPTTPATTTPTTKPPTTTPAPPRREDALPPPPPPPSNSPLLKESPETPRETTREMAW